MTGPAPNLGDYDEACRAFTWPAARARLDGLPGGRGLNIAHEAVDRHAAGPLADHVALRFVTASGVEDVTYAALRERTSRFANLLGDLGVRRGDRVALLLGREPALFTAMLGAFKAGAVVSPLFPAFGPDPVRDRLRMARARVLVTTRSQYARKVERQRDALPDLAHVLLAEELDALLAGVSPSFTIPGTDPDDPALLHFTSGTTGAPKGALHVHDAAVAHHATAYYALDLHPDDVFWCTADPGWVTGTSYGVVAPLLHGVTSVVDNGDFDAGRWYDLLATQRVTVWYTSPTALRMLMRTGAARAAAYDLSALRVVASVGEPLAPDVVRWATATYGVPVLDTWWQTETGGIMLANFRSADVRPGSMGRPLPGVVAAVAARDDEGRHTLRDGRLALVDDPSTSGELVLRPGWPSMFRGYLDDEERYRRCFAGGWYLSGDLVRRDADGYYWFVARGDDVIKTSGHLVGPFEVEAALAEHPAVGDVAVVGVPDDVAGQVVRAVVVVREPYEPTEQLRLELVGFGRKRLGAAVAPRQVVFADTIPRTPSGKIQRRLLREDAP